MDRKGEKEGEEGRGGVEIGRESIGRKPLVLKLSDCHSVTAFGGLSVMSSSVVLLITVQNR